MWSFGLSVFEADDSFACLTRLSSIGGCGLAETVGLCFFVLTPTVLRLSPSWISCVLLVFGFLFSFVLRDPTNSTVVDRELTPWSL